MGAVMHFQRTLNRFSRENVPGYLAVFIGGFGDMFAGCLSRVEKGFPGFLPGVAYATAYYHLADDLLHTRIPKQPQHPQSLTV